jgi:acyl-ACP thioesterase
MARPVDAAVELVPAPGAGRRVERRRKVRLADVTPAGRLRLDALARYLQDVAGDDADEADHGDDTTWVVRRTLVRVEAAPVFREDVEVATWCSGFGSRWAERRTSVRGGHGGRAEAVSLWVHVDTATGRPVRLDDRFHEVWGPSTRQRRVGARLLLGEPPAATDLERQPWPLRVSDYDVLGHVNNAAYWEAVEQALAGRRTGGVVQAEMEYGVGIGRDEVVEVLRRDHDDAGFDLWFSVAGATTAAARVRPLPALS